MLLAPALAALALAGALAGPAAAAAPGDTRLAERMERALNRVRAAHGLPALMPAAPLSRGAAAHSRSMVRFRYFGHARRIRPPGFQMAGEVIEWHLAPRGNVRLAIRWWLRSPGHRHLLLDRRFRYVGAGTATGARWRIWTVRFGAK